MAKLYFYYAAMNAGKSTTLLQADFNYRERGMQTMLWTAAIDDRAAAGMIGSRIGLEAEADRYCDDTNLFEWNKFTGYDRIETGTRANVGLQYTFQANYGGYARVLAGESFQIAGEGSAPTMTSFIPGRRSRSSRHVSPQKRSIASWLG